MRYVLLFLCCLIAACSSKYAHERPVDYVTVIANLPDCPRPEKVKLEHINSEEHIGSIDNTNIIDEVIITLHNYNKQLEEALNCYEKRRSILESPSVDDTMKNITSKEEKGNND